MNGKNYVGLLSTPLVRFNWVYYDKNTSDIFLLGISSYGDASGALRRQYDQRRYPTNCICCVTSKPWRQSTATITSVDMNIEPENVKVSISSSPTSFQEVEYVFHLDTPTHYAHNALSCISLLRIETQVSRKRSGVVSIIIHNYASVVTVTIARI